METKTNTNNAFLIHISALSSIVFPIMGVVLPLVLWQVKKDQSEFLDRHGKEAVNFNISYLLYTFILGLAFIPMFIVSFFRNINNIGYWEDNFFLDLPNLFGFFGGISLIAVLGIAWFVLVLLAAVKANQGEFYKYPFTIKFLK
ncbi:DUF4870 domain-containing protein [Urechidicola sp. KH5]